jgi:hypothetical protein
MELCTPLLPLFSSFSKLPSWPCFGHGHVALMQLACFEFLWPSLCHGTCARVPHPLVIIVVIATKELVDRLFSGITTEIITNISYRIVAAAAAASSATTTSSPT